MIVYFDTSALVRRYHRTEPGADAVRSLARASAGNELVILTITSVEARSAFNRKLRDGVIDATQHAKMWRLFLAHRRTQYREIAVEAPILRRAERLLGRHPLRAYDAMQLAGALLLAPSTPPRANLRFCTADRTQALAAATEGLAVELIA